MANRKRSGKDAAGQYHAVMAIKVVFAVLAAAWAATASGSQNRPVQSDQQILIQLERDWDVAFLHNDARFIENVLADDVVVTYPDGSRGDKAKELTLAAEFDQQVDSSTLDEFIVKVNGNTAVVWFTRHLVGPSQGRQIKLSYRYIDVFVWRDDRWRCIASQSVKIAAP
jgi:ketosteroid isomerase-like protein